MVIFTAVLAAFLYAQITIERKIPRDIALNQAIGILNKMDDLSHWNLSYESLYAVMASDTPVQLLIPPGSIMTSDGKKLSRVFFPTIISKVGEIGNQTGKISIRISSLQAMNPDFQPDKWERASLVNLELGGQQQAAFVKGPEGSVSFRFMRPIYIKESCLSCHEDQGRQAGDIIAGITAIVPADNLLARTRSHLFQFALTLSLLWLVGTAFFIVLIRHKEHDRLRIQELNEMSLVDPLTGLSNRRGFLTLAQQQALYAERNGLSATLLFMDLDKFKQINDTFGHQVGDEVLIRFAKVLLLTFRTSDIVSRFGGDEFVVLALDAPMDESTTIIQRLEYNLEKNNEASGKPYRLSASVGSASFDPKKPQMLELLVLEADEKMYIAKKMKNAPKTR